jgi:hypothetical protein
MGLAALRVGVRAASEAGFRKPCRSLGVSDVQPGTGELEFEAIARVSACLG